VGLFVEKKVSFVVFRVQLGLAGFRLSKVRADSRVSVRIRVSSVLVIGWDRTSRRVICRVPDV